MTLKDVAGTIMACAACIGLAYTVATRGGWIVSAADAQTMAQQQVLSEAKARELADVKLQLSRALDRYEYLTTIAAPSPAQALEIELVKRDIGKLRDRQEELER